MATGALDGNGVWQYGEDDSVSPWSTYMNKLAASITNRLSEARSWRSVGTVASTQSITINTATSVCPAAVTITNAKAGTYLLLGTSNVAIAGAGTAATAQFLVGATLGAAAIVFEPRNDVSNIGYAQTHAWTFDHAGGTVVIDYRILVPASAATNQVQGSGLVVTRIL